MFFAIEEFVALGQTQSFTGAAKRLGVSASHISRRINSLEDKLGVRLVQRTTRVVRLTDAGFEYYEKCLQITDQMEEANSALILDTNELEGRVKVSAAGDYAERWVAPSLARFAIAHPKLRIEMDFNPRNINLVDDGFDFAIRYGTLSDSSLVARKLTERRLIAAASPAYLAQHEDLSHPNQLLQHRCIVSVNDNWQFIEKGVPLTVKVTAAWKSNSAVSLIESAKAGAGICYLPETTLQASIEDKSLVPILQAFSISRIPTWIVYPSKRYLPMRVRAAIDFIMADLNTDVSTDINTNTSTDAATNISAAHSATN